ncbi:MAG: hypothetical protein JKY67_00305 [Pseudomonadales bacterium]|nr:hypothetical protein [Pseudomonadales bacterium]
MSGQKQKVEGHNAEALSKLPLSGDGLPIAPSMSVTVVDSTGTTASGIIPHMFVATVVSVQTRTIRARKENDKAVIVMPHMCFFDADRAMRRYKAIGGHDEG